MPDFKRFDLCREDHLDLFTTRHCGLKNLPHNYLKPGSAAVGAGSVEVKIPNFCVPYSKTPLVEEVMIESSISPPAVRLKDIAVGVVALSEAARPQSTCKRVQPNSRAGRIGFMGVRTRKGVRGYLVEIRPPKWKRTIWLGTYKTAEEAACAYDAGVFYTRKKTKHNFPELEATFPPLPCHLRFDSADDLEEIKLFVQKQARQVTLFARNRRLSPTQIVTNSKQILEGELAAIAIAGESDPRDLAPDHAKLEEEDHVTADVSEGVSMMDLSTSGSATESLPGIVSVKKNSESENVTASQESQAEVTADSPCEDETGGFKSSRDHIVEDLISRFSVTIRKHVEEALNSTLLPLVSALRSREEDEQKHREKLLALDVAKLALKRQKLQLKQRRHTIARSLEPCSCSARSGSDRYELREKKNPNIMLT